jgi:membrane-associated protease RseP (regulator of RpoE activity)
MKREYFIAICGVIFMVMLIAALFTNKGAQSAAEGALHEIRTADLWQQSAYTNPACPVYPQTRQGYYYPNRAAGMQQAAAAAPIMAGLPDRTVIQAGQQPPALIKQMGAEVVPVGGGKVKIAGVMGSSWADKAGLKPGDILLSFNTKKITGLAQFQDLITKAPPEKNYKVTYLRGARKRKCSLTVGEGEMEGFTPIR